MQQHGHVESLRGFEQAAELRLIRKFSVQIRIEQDPFHPQLVHATLQLGDGRVHVLQRQHGQSDESRGMRLRHVRDEIVQQSGNGGTVLAEQLRTGVIDAERGHADAGRIHVGQLRVDVRVARLQAAMPVPHDDVDVVAFPVNVGRGLALLHERDQLGHEEVALAVETKPLSGAFARVLLWREQRLQWRETHVGGVSASHHSNLRRQGGRCA